MQQLKALARWLGISAAPARDMTSLPATSFPGIEWPHDGSVPPHCDPTILHAPGACGVCDLYPNWQTLRETWWINFTGQNETNKAPCPSLHGRPAEVRDRWPGNRPGGWSGT